MRTGCSVVVVALLALAGCGSDTTGLASANGPAQPGPESEMSGLALSAPVAEPPASGSEPGTVVFVSVSPGSVAGAASAQVRTGGATIRTISTVDGGFDPVAVPGAAGDTVSVTITDSAGKSTATSGTAKERARPRVVRTSPAPRRTDVPLNAIIKVVFSAPMVPESVLDGVRLLQGATVVTVTVVASDASGLIFDVRPAAELESGVSYRLVIEATVTDVNGTSLGEADSVPFTTATPSPQPATLKVIVRTVGENIDADGYVVQVWKDDPGSGSDIVEGRVAVNDTLLLDGEFSGTRHVYLMGVSGDCVVDDDAMRRVTIAEAMATESFMVRCSGSGGSDPDPVGTGTVRVHMYSSDTIPGRRPVVRQGCNSDPFCPRAFVTYMEPAVFHGVPAGMQGFALENGAGCGTVLPLSFIFIDVRAGETVDISFPVICSSG